MRYTQAISNRIQVLCLGHTTIIGQRISTAYHFITSITCFDKALSNIAHVHNRYNIFARTKNKSLTRFHQSNKAAKTGVIARPLNPARSHNHDWRPIISHEVRDQLLTGDLGTTIWIVLSMKRVFLSHNTMEMVAINGD